VRPARKSLCFLLLLIQYPLFAQIKGRVLSKANTPAAYVNILLVKSADSSLVKGAVSDENGNFLIEGMETGNYRLRISFLGYQKVLTPVFTLKSPGDTYDAGTILLKPDEQTLKNVEIVAEKPFIERHIDRLVVNIDKSIVASGTDGLELFKRLPGVTVNQDGVISLKNKAGVLILINGRPSNLSPADLASLLKSMNADQIDRIEIMVNPPAKYDAAGSAGVINIILKKNQALGLNGSLRTNLRGSYEKVFPEISHVADCGITLNYRTRKWNFFGSFDFSTGHDYWGRDITNRFYSGGQLQNVLTQHLIQGSNEDDFAARAGIDYEVTKRQTIGFLASARNILGVASNNLNRTEMTDAEGHRLSGLDSYFNVYEPIHTNDANIYYDFKIDSTGRELNINADYLRFYSPNEHSLYYYNYDANNQFLAPIQHIISGQTININIASLKADYTHTFGKKIKLDAGVKTAEVLSDNDGKYFDIANGVSTLDAGMSNHFIYTENINAAYLNYSQELSSKLSLQAGLRGEQTRVKGQLLPRDTTFTHTYTNLFPTLFLNWKLSDKHVLNLSYSKRIDRPEYSSVNPFLYARGPYTYYGGNASLRPQYTQSIELSHVYKGVLNTTLGYSQTSDDINLVSTQNDSSHITYSKYYNINTRINYSLNVSLSLPFTKWWTSTNFAGIYYSNFQGVWMGDNLSHNMLTGVLNSQNTFRLTKRWSLEVSAVLVSKQAEGFSTRQPFYLLDAGLQWKFAEERGSLRINAGDLLFTHFQLDTQYQNMNITEVNYSNSRYLNIGLRWKLGSSTTSHRDKARGGSEELNRLKGG
jgi:iron complex outermembrane receptor protein